MRFELAIEIIEHDAGLDDAAPAHDVEREDAAKMLGAVDHQPPIDGLSALGGARAAGRDGHAFLASQRKGSKRRLNGFGDHHAERRHLVMRRVGRVAAAAECVEEDVPLDLAFQALFESRARRLNHFSRLRENHSNSVASSGQPFKVR